MSKFVIFATARSGSTSLAKVLAESKDVKMAMEPFHESFSKWNPKERDYSTFIKDEKSMGTAIEEIFKKHTAIKVLQYQFPEPIYFELLKRKDLKILFLKRRNNALARISGLIAEQTSIWQKSDTKKVDPEVFNNLKSLDINELKKRIAYVEEQVQMYKKFLEDKRKGDYLDLFYEDLYSESIDKNVKTITEICMFLEISPPPLKAIKKYMLPSEAQISYNNLYKKVPNYNELAKEFNL
jgi:LPS sulfotransferase NodH